MVQFNSVHFKFIRIALCNTNDSKADLQRTKPKPQVGKANVTRKTSKKRFFSNEAELVRNQFTISEINLLLYKGFHIFNITYKICI